MADTKSVNAAVETTPAEVKKELVMIEIPERDMFDYPHPPVQINSNYNFEPGQTYWVEKDIATEVNRILKAKERQDIRVLQPRIDQRAINDLNKGGHRAYSTHDAGTR